jgi:hypothetical protein
MMLTDNTILRPDGAEVRMGDVLTGPTLLILLRHLA